VYTAQLDSAQINALIEAIRANSEGLSYIILLLGMIVGLQIVLIVSGMIKKHL